MERIKNQANTLWQLLTAPSTANAYQQAIALTWSILKETAQLLLYVFFLTVVLGEWFYRTATNAGRNTRTWIETLQNQPTPTEAKDPSQLLQDTGKSLLAAGQSSLTQVLNTAREQLGLEAPPAPPTKVLAPVQPAIAPTPTPAPTPTAPTPSDSSPPSDTPTDA